MGNLSFLSAISYELSKERILKSEDLSRVLVSTDIKPEKKLKKILKAIREYKEVVGDIQTWEKYMEENITIPNNKNPEMENNNKEKQ